MHPSTAPLLPPSSTDVLASTSCSTTIASSNRFSPQTALAYSFSHFFSPSSPEYWRSRSMGVRVREKLPIFAALTHEEEAEDKGWFRPGGSGRGQFRGRDGGRDAGRGRGAPPRGNAIYLSQLKLFWLRSVIEFL